jgi:phage shock protein PspC (stress-responsive transcriptional regulator)
MNKVITIHLAGRAYQLEEPGYDLLQHYLEEAAVILKDNPDKDEIIGDLEAALAEKCQAYLKGHKNVATTREIEQILSEMGPVRGDASENIAADSSDSATNTNSEKNHQQESESANIPKKLYQIHQGAWISGVCTGLAAYFNLDVTLIRVIFVLLAVFTHGAMALVYFLMMIIVPHADTPEERAQAFGTLPVTAQDLVNRAKEGYEHFKNSDEWRRWKHQMKSETRQWKQQWRYERRRQYGHPIHWQYSPFWEFMHMLIGLVWMLVIGFLLWFSYYHVPAIHQFLDLLPQWIAQGALWIKHKWIVHVH